MNGIDQTVLESGGGNPAGFFSRERTIAGPNFNRWLVPTAALAIHLCIGMAYGFSVFWLPMTHILANTDAAMCGDIGFFQALFTTTCNWTVPQVTPLLPKEYTRLMEWADRARTLRVRAMCARGRAGR